MHNWLMSEQDRQARRISNAQEAHVAVLNVSLSDARRGRVEDPDSPAFTGDFAEHQKAYVSYEVCDFVWLTDGSVLTHTCMSRSMH